jgi:predicted PurR-regulated permease PerM
MLLDPFGGGRGAASRRALILPLTILAWLGVLAAAVWVLAQVATTLVLVLVAAVVALAIDPVVRALARWLPDPAAIAAAYLLAVVAVLGLGTAVVVTAARQVVALVAELPTYATAVEAGADSASGALAPFGVTDAALQSLVGSVASGLQGLASGLATGAVAVLGSLAAIVVDAILTLVLSVYMTANGPRLVGWLERETPPPIRRWAAAAVAVVSQVVGGYVRGTLVVATLLAAEVGATTTLLGTPYPAVLGVLAFSMAFIPVLGTFAMTTAAVLLTLPQGPLRVAAVLAAFAVVYLLNDYVVWPRVIGRAVGIHPAISVVALIAGTELFGISGALFASPVAGLLQAVVIALWRGAVLPAPGRPAGATASRGDSPPAESPLSSPPGRS